MNKYIYKIILLIIILIFLFIFIKQTIKIKKINSDDITIKNLPLVKNTNNLSQELRFLKPNEYVFKKLSEFSIAKIDSRDVIKREKLSLGESYNNFELSKAGKLHYKGEDITSRYLSSVGADNSYGAKNVFINIENEKYLEYTECSIDYCEDMLYNIETEKFTLLECYKYGCGEIYHWNENTGLFVHASHDTFDSENISVYLFDKNDIYFLGTIFLDHRDINSNDSEYAHFGLEGTFNPATLTFELDLYAYNENGKYEFARPDGKILPADKFHVVKNINAPQN